MGVGASLRTGTLQKNRRYKISKHDEEGTKAGKDTESYSSCGYVDLHNNVMLLYGFAGCAT